MDFENSKANHKPIFELTYDEIDTLTPGAADRYAEESDFDYQSDLELKQKLKLEVTNRRLKLDSEKQQGQASLAKAKQSYTYILEEETKKRERLLNHVEEFEKSVEKLEEITRSGANTNMDSIIKETNKFKKEKDAMMVRFLPVRPNPILITGETASGKSSFVNLLLNDDIMPVAFEKNTSTFCIISRAEQKKATVHFKTIDNETPRPVIIENLSNEDFKKDCGKYLESKQRNVAYMELQCPSDILKDNVEIMDSPGMGDPDFVEGLEEKIKNACAFVYILKHFNPLAEDIRKQAEKIKESCRSCYKASNHHLDMNTMVFVINKWDIVQSEKESTYEFICKRLDKFMDVNISRNRILTMSVRDARYMQKNDVIAEDYIKFLNLLHTLQISSITNQTRKFHTLTVEYMHQVINKLKFIGGVNLTNMKERQKLADDLDRSRREIQESKDKHCEELKRRYKENFKKAAEKLVKSLHDKKYHQSFVDRMMEEIPFTADKTIMSRELTKRAAHKLMNVLEEIEEKESVIRPVFDSMYNELFMKFSEFEQIALEAKNRLYEEVSKQLPAHFKEVDLSATFIERSLPRWSAMNKKQKIVFGVVMPVFAPFLLGLFIISLHIKILGKLVQKIPFLNTPLTPETRISYVREKTEELYHRYVSKESYMHEYGSTIFDKAWDSMKGVFDAAESELNNLATDANLLRKKTEEDEDWRIIQFSKTFNQQLRDYLSTLYKFDFECLQYDNVIPESIFTYEDERRPLCSSIYSAMYQVTIAEDADEYAESLQDFGHFGKLTSKPAALRRVFWTPMCEDVDRLRAEIQYSIACSNDPHILQMRTVVKSSAKAEVINVSLLCEAVDMTFRKFLRQKTPDMTDKDKYEYLYEHFRNIRDGLHYLHSHKVKFGEVTMYLTGCELNLDTIMVTLAGQVKLTNIKMPGALGFSAHIVHSQDRVHYHRHLPPPVLLERREYDKASDLYSMAISQYEAWFRTEAFLGHTFNRDKPINSLKAFASSLDDPIEILKSEQEIHHKQCNLTLCPQNHEIDFESEEGRWFKGIERMIEDYMKKKDRQLTAENWPSYFDRR